MGVFLGGKPLWYSRNPHMPTNTVDLGKALVLNLRAYAPKQCPRCAAR